MNRVNIINRTPINLVNSDYVGMNKNQAFARCIEKGLSYRVVEEDGKCFIITMDIRGDRVNFNINNGVVTSHYLG